MTVPSLFLPSEPSIRLTENCEDTGDWGIAHKPGRKICAKPMRAFGVPLTAPPNTFSLASTKLLAAAGKFEHEVSR